MKQLSRRDFLAGTGAAAACASVPALLHGQASKNYLFPAGIQLYAVREPVTSDAPGTLMELHSIGYREVETAGLGKYTAKQFHQAWPRIYRLRANPDCSQESGPGPRLRGTGSAAHPVAACLRKGKLRVSPFG